MPKAYSDDLRLRAVWLHVFLGYNIEDTSGMLAMSPSSVKRFKKKFVRTGEVVAKKTGRPLDLVGMHPREELVLVRGFTSFLYSHFPLFEIINQNNLVDFI